MKNYPKPIRSESGCKISWYYYDNLKDAEKASIIAAEEGVRLWNLGYDFGYQTPGCVVKLKDKEEWYVIIP
jgi:hypothetical protein